MMLDTNAISAWASSDRALFGVFPKDRVWRIPVVALGEFLFGVQRSTARRRLEIWIQEVVAACVVVPTDVETASHYAQIREHLRTAATPIPENDIWIAALCRQHDEPLASMDAHFDLVPGIRRVAW